MKSNLLWVIAAVLAFLGAGSPVFATTTYTFSATLSNVEIDLGSIGVSPQFLAAFIAGSNASYGPQLTGSIVFKDDLSNFTGTVLLIPGTRVPHHLLDTRVIVTVLLLMAVQKMHSVG